MPSVRLTAFAITTHSYRLSFSFTPENTGRIRAAAIGAAATTLKPSGYYAHTAEILQEPLWCDCYVTLRNVYLERHLEGVVHEEPPGEDVALAQQDLDHLCRLQKPIARKT